MLGALWMLAWLGLSSSLLRRSFWMPENLMATAFDGDAPIHADFAAATVAGLALYLVIYGTLGVLVALVLRDKMLRGHVLVWSVTFGLIWYYASFHGIWQSAIPLLARLHVERATVLGHLVYGTVLARYPVYLKRWDQAAEPVATAPVTAEAIAEEAPLNPTGSTPGS